MKILCDFHHSDLWWSSHLILEKALGHQFFRPRGMEWHEQGYIFPKIYDVAKQFLVDSMYDFDFAFKHFELARPRLTEESDDTLFCGMDTINGCPRYPLFRTLTLEEFKDAKIDVIMATMTDHQEPFLRLRDKYHPKAKLLREAGNPGELPHLHPAYENLLTSDKESYIGSSAKNKVLYHQQFDMSIFKYSPPEDRRRIGSFMPTFMLEDDAVKFLKDTLALMPGFDFKAYGVNGDAYLNTKGELAKAMNDCAFVWQYKRRGDGFGHVVHNAFALGRPPIVVARHYSGRLVEDLMRDMETCVFISDDVASNAKKILAAMDRLPEMSRKAREAFDSMKNEKDIIKEFVEHIT